MTTIDDETKQVLSWEDFSEEDETEIEHEFKLIVPEDEKYAKALWYNGYNSIVEYNPKIKKYVSVKDKDGKELKNNGMFFKCDSIPEDLTSVFERMADDESLPEQDRLVRQVSVQHESGEVVEYWQLNHNKVRFFPLMVGLARLDDIAKGNSSLGAAYVVDLFYNRKDATYSLNKRLAVLFIVDALYNYGYRDEQGNPKLIQFSPQSIPLYDFYAVLKRHMASVAFANKKGIKFATGKKPEAVEPYMIGFRFNCEKETYYEGTDAKGQKVKSKAIAIDAHIPGFKEISENYINEMYAGKELHFAMKKMLYQLVVVRDHKVMEASGPVIKWCEERIENAIAGYQKINPNGIRLHWGTHPAPSWMIAIDRGETPQMMPAAQEEKLDVETLKRKAQMLHAFFTEQQDEAIIGIIDAMRLDLDKDPSQEDLVAINKEILKLLEQKKAMEEPIGEDNVPF